MSRIATDFEIDTVWRPLMLRLVKQHGKERAKRIFRQAVEKAGLDPNEVRVFFKEDLS